MLKIFSGLWKAVILPSRSPLAEKVLFPFTKPLYQKGSCSIVDHSPASASAFPSPDPDPENQIELLHSLYLHIKAADALKCQEFMARAKKTSYHVMLSYKPLFLYIQLKTICLVLVSY